MLKKFILIYCFVYTINLIHAQPWIKDSGKALNFFEIQNQFKDYWKDKNNPGGAGYNVFKRWEWYWETRVGKNGEFPPSNHLNTEWSKFLKTNSKRSIKLNWESKGPFTTPSGYYGLGRINCMAFHPTDANTFWVGTPGGGIWKTINSGTSWTINSDKNPVLGVSSIVVHPTKPDTMYIATGDGDRGSLSGLTGGPRGDTKSVGILKSVDGGKTWNTTGLNWTISQALLIRTLIMHPKKPWILLCATSDGVYRTANAGASWSKVSNGFFMDIEFKPNNYDVVYATTFDLNGNVKFLRSLNNGMSFTTLKNFPNGVRIKIGTTAANANKLHLLVAHKQGAGLEGIYESLDSGDNIQLKFDQLNLLSNKYDGSGDKGQGWYDLSYNISPIDENLIFIGGVNTWKSTDGGSNWELNNFWTGYSGFNPNGVNVVHADKHYFICHPLEPSIRFDCNDGGIYISSDDGENWQDITGNMAITQFYKIGISEIDTNIIIGGTQDNGARMYYYGSWQEATGGDGMECAIDYNDPNVVYSSYAYGVLYRNDDAFQSFSTETISNNIHEGGKGAWVTPFIIDPNNSATLYAGYKQLYKSTDYGYNWEAILDSVTNPNLLRNIAVAKGNSNIIYCGDFYNIFKTSNGGNTWNKIITTTLPITNIKVHPTDPDIIYYTNSSYTAGSKVFVYLSNQSQNISYNLPNISINCITIDSTDNFKLYIGTDLGVFYTDSSLTEWINLNNNLPNVVVTDMEINRTSNKLVVATYGRGIWQTSLEFNITQISSLKPEHNSIENPRNSSLEIVFDKPVFKGSGELMIFENGILKKRINPDSPQLVINNNVVEINHGLLFDHDATIKVMYNKGFFIDNNNKPVPALVFEAWKFNVKNTMSTQNIELNAFDVLPNPSDDFFEIHCNSCSENSNYFFYDYTGKLIANGGLNQSKTQLNTKDFKSGIYLLFVEMNSMLYYKKIIIEH